MKTASGPCGGCWAALFCTTVSYPSLRHALSPLFLQTSFMLWLTILMEKGLGTQCRTWLGLGIRTGVRKRSTNGPFRLRLPKRTVGASLSDTSPYPESQPESASADSSPNLIWSLSYDHKSPASLAIWSLSYDHKSPASLAKLGNLR
jgi:hypothetical protein